MRTIAKEIRFEAAHRLKGKNGTFYPKKKCGSVHGHSFWVKIKIAQSNSEPLNNFDFVKDYADFKGIKDWIMDEFDHATLVGRNDKDLIHFLEEQGDRYIIMDIPSSEKIAERIYRAGKAYIPNISEVTIKETCTSEATYSEPPQLQ